MAIHYETKATNVGGRKGHVYTDDRALDIDIVPPAQADGKATEPRTIICSRLCILLQRCFRPNFKAKQSA